MRFIDWVQNFKMFTAEWLNDHGFCSVERATLYRSFIDNYMVSQRQLGRWVAISDAEYIQAWLTVHPEDYPVSWLSVGELKGMLGIK